MSTNDATTLGIAPDERGLGSRHSGAWDNRPHYVGVATERPTAGALTESRLRTLREEAGMSQDSLGELTRKIEQEQALTDPKAGAMNPQRPGERVYGVTGFSINRYENGVHAPRPRYLKLLALALSQALRREITTADLQVNTAAGLVTYLEKVRHDAGAPLGAFYAQLGVASPLRAQALVAGATEWTADELGRAAVLFPQARTLTQDVLIEQARKRDPTLTPMGYPVPAPAPAAE